MDLNQLLEELKRVSGGEGFVQDQEMSRTSRRRRVWVTADRGNFRSVIQKLVEMYTYPQLSFIVAQDLGDRLQLIYSFEVNSGKPLEAVEVSVKVDIPKDDPRIETITDMFPGAEVYEREAQEMIGVDVVGLPDKRRLLIPEDFPEGVFPLRVDEKGIPPELWKKRSPHPLEGDGNE